jgi:hypothetical protein
MELQGSQGHPVNQVLRDQKVQVVFQAVLELMGFQDHKEMLEIQVQMVSLVRKVQMDSQALPERLE